MDVLRALVLGLVQGVTEFLPVSSSGHLVLVRQLLGWPDPGLAFDAALHLGTLLAVLVAFWPTWRGILRGRDHPIVGWLVLGTLPGLLAGFFGETVVANRFRGLPAISVSFLATAGLLLAADYANARRRGSQTLGARVALLVGIAQAFALLPGLSRSGATMAAGLFLGLPRVRAVEFSFLLALPITAVASVEGLRQLLVLAPSHLLPAAVGMLLAAVVGLLTIRVFLSLVRRRSFVPFALYLLILGAVLLTRG